MTHNPDYSRSNLGPPANDNEPTRYGYQLWASTQPANDDDCDDLDDYEFNQDMATGTNDD